MINCAQCQVLCEEHPSAVCDNCRKENFRRRGLSEDRLTIKYPVDIQIAGTSLTPVSYATRPPTYMCNCGNMRQLYKPDVDYGRRRTCGECKKSKPATWPINEKIPGSHLIPISYDPPTYQCECGTIAQLNKNNVDFINKRTCGACKPCALCNKRSLDTIKLFNRNVCRPCIMEELDNASAIPESRRETDHQ